VRTKKLPWFIGLLFIVLAMPFAYFVWLKINLRKGVIDALSSSSSVVVIWRGWHPKEFEQRGFRLNGSELDKFATALKGRLGTGLAPSESLARPRITLLFCDEAEKPFGVALIPKSQNSQTIESIDRVIKFVELGSPLSKSEIDKFSDTNAPSLSSRCRLLELNIQ
jgi:hypothetical protein